MVILVDLWKHYYVIRVLRNGLVKMKIHQEFSIIRCLSMNFVWKICTAKFIVNRCRSSLDFRGDTKQVLTKSSLSPIKKIVGEICYFHYFITKLRCSYMKFPIETRRWNSIPRENRILIYAMIKYW